MKMFCEKQYGESIEFGMQKFVLTVFSFTLSREKNSTCIQLTEGDFYFGCQKISSEEGGKGKRSGSETNTVSELDSLSSSVLLYLNY